MTATLDPPSPALAAATTHHDDLRASLTRLSESLIACIGDRAAFTAARDQLIAFLRNELLPHAEVEDRLLYTAVRTPSTALLVRAMQDEHRMIGALVDEVEHARTPIDAAVAAGALVVLCDVRIEQENQHLLPSLEAAGLDLTQLIGDQPEIVGHPADLAQPTVAETRSVDLRGLDYYNRRHRLFTALHSLTPGEEVRLISDCAHDVSWLRFEMEARMPERFRWTVSYEAPEVAHTTVRRPQVSTGS